MLCLSRGSIKSPENMWILSNKDHGQGVYCFSSLLTLKCEVYSLFSETCKAPIMRLITFWLKFSARLSFTRTRTSRVGVMSAAMTAQTFTHTSAVATPSGWRVAALWSMSDRTSWAISTSWGKGSILTIKNGWASVAVSDHAGWYQWYVCL